MSWDGRFCLVDVNLYSNTTAISNTTENWDLYCPVRLLLLARCIQCILSSFFPALGMICGYSKLQRYLIACMPVFWDNTSLCRQLMVCWENMPRAANQPGHSFWKKQSWLLSCSFLTRCFPSLFWANTYICVVKMVFRDLQKCISQKKGGSWYLWLGMVGGEDWITFADFEIIPWQQVFCPTFCFAGVPWTYL